MSLTFRERAALDLVVRHLFDQSWAHWCSPAWTLGTWTRAYVPCGPFTVNDGT